MFYLAGKHSAVLFIFTGPKGSSLYSYLNLCNYKSYLTLLFSLNHKTLLLELCLCASFTWSSECCYLYVKKLNNNDWDENKDYCNKMIYLTSKEGTWQTALNCIEFTFAIKEMSVLSNDTFNCLHLMQDILSNKGETFKHNEELSRADCRSKALLLSIIGSLG